MKLMAGGSSHVVRSSGFALVGECERLAEFECGICGAGRVRTECAGVIGGD